MIAGLIGRAFRSLAALRRGDAGDDMDQVGAELLRLERRSPQAPTTSR